MTTLAIAAEPLHGKTDASSVTTDSCVVTRCSIVPDVPYQSQPDADLLRFGDRCLSSHHRGHVPEETITIDDHRCRVLVYDTDIGSRIQIALVELLTVAGRPGDSVATHATQVRIGEQPRHHRGMIGADPHVLETGL